MPRLCALTYSEQRTSAHCANSSRANAGISPDLPENPLVILGRVDIRQDGIRSNLDVVHLARVRVHDSLSTDGGIRASQLVEQRARKDDRVSVLPPMDRAGDGRSGCVELTNQCGDD